MLGLVAAADRDSSARSMLRETLAITPKRRVGREDVLHSCFLRSGWPQGLIGKAMDVRSAGIYSGGLNASSKV